MAGNWMRSKTVRWCAALAALLIIGTHQVQAQAEPRLGEVIRGTYLVEWGDGEVRGITYAAPSQQFFALVSRAAGGMDASVADKAELVVFTPFVERAEIISLGEGLETARAIAFDNAGSRLLLLRGDFTQIVQMKTDEQGYLVPTGETLFDSVAWGLASAQGMAVANDGSRLFILDSANAQLVSVGLHAEISPPDVQKHSLSYLAASDLRGLAIHPATGHLFVLSLDQQMLYELSQTGEQLATHATVALDLTGEHHLVFAPSADLTDAAEQSHLYLLESVVLDVQAESKAWSHRLLEVTFDAPRPESMAAGIAATPLPLIQTVETSAFSPPSPDPSGVAYLAPADVLLITDGEVDEVTIFTGDNLFAAKRDGTLAYTSSTMVFSDEPTDVAYNPHNQHIFYAEDDAWRIFEVDPGRDGSHGTEDDSLTSFSTSDFGSLDPEGLAFDAVHGVLYIADGTNREIYRVDPGANGRFDGIAASGGDDVVTHFDVLVSGIEDPEGIEYEAVSGHLLVTGNSKTQFYELTTSGGLVATYDISAAQVMKPAGIAMAPGSTDSNKASFYIVDRGIDNNDDPTENDGRMFEFGSNVSFPTPMPTATPSATPTNTPAPTPTATATPLGDVIFEDSFESGDLAAWSSSQSNGAALSVNNAAALSGQYGLQATIQDNFSIYVVDDSPAAEPRYRARFYFDPNSTAIAEGDLHNLFYAYSGDLRAIRLIFGIAGGVYQLRPGLFGDGDLWIPANWVPISDGPHLIEFDWQAASPPGSNNGYLKFWLDGVQIAAVTGVDNDTLRIDEVRLGMAAGIDDGTRGVYYFDAFASRRQSYIGPAPDAPIPTRLMLPFIYAD